MYLPSRIKDFECSPQTVKKITLSKNSEEISPDVKKSPPPHSKNKLNK